MSGILVHLFYFGKHTYKPNVLVAQSCPTFYNRMDCSPPGSSLHGILQERILEWVAIFFSRGSSWPKDWTLVSGIAGRFFTIWATRKALDKSLKWDGFKNSVRTILITNPEAMRTHQWGKRMNDRARKKLTLGRMLSISHSHHSKK